MFIHNFRFSSVLLCMVFLGCLGFQDLRAQAFLEPEIRERDTPRTPLDYGLRNGATFMLTVNNNGFAVGGQYRRVIGPMTEFVGEFQIGAIKDSREQAFFNFWGQQVIPNKYNRILTFPVMIGVRQRVLADYVSDNIRIFLQGSAGPALTFSYPYFNDLIFNDENFPTAGELGNTDGLPLGVRLNERQINDVFSGWGDGEWILGYNGKASITVDFGSGFGSLTSIEFGAHIFYYPNGLQIMEPNSIEVNNNVVVDRILGGGFSKQNWNITPTITLMFGGMW